MASVLQVNTIKDSGGNATGITVADSSANVTINQLTASTGFPAGGTGNPISIAAICDQKSQNTNAGTFTHGAWRTRDLNTEIFDTDSIVTISSNQFTLGAGTYLINWSAPAMQVNRHQSALYDVTGTSYKEGSSEYCSDAGHAQTRSVGTFMATYSSNNVFEIRHQCQTTKDPFGFGLAANFTLERYTYVEIYKLK